MEAPMHRRHLYAFLMILAFVILVCTASTTHAAPAPTQTVTGVAVVHDLVTVDGLHYSYAPALAIAVLPSVGLQAAAAPTPSTSAEDPLMVDDSGKPLPQPSSSVEELFTAIYRAVTKDKVPWFMLAGAILSLLCWPIFYALESKWRWFAKDWVRYGGVAVLAGGIGLGNAWLAGVDPDAMTLRGALLVFISAIWAHVTAKKILAGGQNLAHVPLTRVTPRPVDYPQ
jgi:hypothetical protein